MAVKAAEKGGKEIVITGVNIGTFGLDNGQNFLDLLKQLELVEGVERYRISSIEPNLLTDDILEWIAFKSKKFMPHFHIPLQSGSDKVLRLMNRRYDTNLFASRISRIRELIPDAFIGVDIIAGARGETNEEWMKSFDFAKNLDIQKFHAFPYSERKGTKALLIGDNVPQEERYRRVSELNKISEEKTLSFIEKNIGSKRKVLWEKGTPGSTIKGLTDNYIPVEAPFVPDLLNQVSEVKILSLKEGTKDTANAEHLGDNDDR